eukprot:Selendium_serpulae@DN5906_c0_g1_i1.p1
MNDWIWIVILCVAQIGFFLVDLRMLFYYEHPDDSKFNQGMLAKVMVLIGLQIAWIVICLTPTDAHATQIGSSINVVTMWEVMFLFLVVFMAVPYPIAIFFYETDSDPRVTKLAPWKKTLIFSAVVFVTCAIVIGVFYAICSKATISEFNCNNKHLPPEMLPGCSSSPPSEITVTTPFMIYLIAFTSFIGWWPFVLFSGVGFVALPFSLIVSFIDRPKPIDFPTYKDKKLILGERAMHLRESGEALKKAKMKAGGFTGIAGMRYRQKLAQESRKFRQSVYLLEEDYKALNVAFKERGENPVLSYCKLILGIFCAIMSFIWFVQIILAILLPQISGLWGDGIMVWSFDNMLVAVNEVEFYGLDLIIYGLLTLYVLVTVVIGCFRFGLRVFLFYAVIPMRKADTHLNRFLFNVAIIVIASGAIAHFSVMAFPLYSLNTGADLIFNHYAENMVMLKAFFKYYILVWVLLVWIIVCIVFFALKPRERSAVSKIVPDVEETPMVDGAGEPAHSSSASAK